MIDYLPSLTERNHSKIFDSNHKFDLFLIENLIKRDTLTTHHSTTSRGNRNLNNFPSNGSAFGNLEEANLTCSSISNRKEG